MNKLFPRESKREEDYANSWDWSWAESSVQRKFTDIRLKQQKSTIKKTIMRLRIQNKIRKGTCLFSSWKWNVPNALNPLNNEPTLKVITYFHFTLKEQTIKLFP